MISVLIVDDNHSFVDSLKVLLKEIPSLTPAKSVNTLRKAEQELAQNLYNLIILENDTEVSLKGMDFIRNIRKNYPVMQPTNFIVFTTKPQELMDKYKADGIKIFKKPLSTHDFKEYIVRLVEQRLLLFGEKEDADRKE